MGAFHYLLVEAPDRVGFKRHVAGYHLVQHYPKRPQVRSCICQPAFELLGGYRFARLAGGITLQFPQRRGHHHQEGGIVSRLPGLIVQGFQISQAGDIFWSMGSEIPHKIAFNQVRPLVTERSKANPKLVTLIKVDREGTYHSLVDIMDELNLASITRFSLAPMEQADKDLMAQATM